MISQTVLYKPYQMNPKAADAIVEIACKYLSNIPGTELRVGKAIPSDRAVNISNGMVIKTTTWKTEGDMAAYFANPQLAQYVKEVLRGWKLQGSPPGPAAAGAFIAHILRGCETCPWERNLFVPDSEVLWGSEQIILYRW